MLFGILVRSGSGRGPGRGRVRRVCLVSGCLLLAPLTSLPSHVHAQTQTPAAATPPPVTSPATAAFLRELLDATDDAARNALLDSHPALVGIELTRALLDEGVRWLREGALDRSLDALRLARTVAERSHDRAASAGVAVRMAQTLSTLGDNDQALALLRESEATYRDLGDTTSMLRVMNNQAIVHRLRGDLDEALALQRRQLAAREPIGDPVSLSVTLNNIGTIQQERGEYRDALVNLQRALSYRRPGTNEYANTLHNLGSVYQSQGDLAVARSYYEQALGEQQIARDRMSTLAMLADVSRGLGQLDAAAAYAEQGVALAEKSGARPMLSVNLRILALILSDRGQHSQALAHLERSLAVARSANEPAAIGSALANLGAVLLADRAYDRALAAAEEALAFGDALDPAGQILAYQVAGQAHAGLAHPAEARRALQASIDRVEDLRTQVSGAAVEQQQFLESHLQPYHSLIDLLIGQRQFGEALQYAERARARTLLDVMQRGHVSLARWLTPDEARQERELERRLGDLQRRQAQAQSHLPTAAAGSAPASPDLAETIAATRREVATLRTRLFAVHPELRLARGEAAIPAVADLGAAILDPSTAVLAYTVTADRAWLFVMTRASGPTGGPQAKVDLRVHALPLNVATLATRVRQFHEALATRELGFASQARALYDDLLGPAAEECKGKTRLILVPDGALWDLPFQALQNASRRYLIEQATVAYAPSLTFLYERHVHAREGSTGAPRPSLDLLALANPTLAAADAAAFKPLPLADDQVRRIATFYPARRVTTLSGAAARESRVKQEASRYRVLHFATHGLLDDGNPLYSSLLLASDASAADDGRLEARELMEIPLSADLVVLSACDTARGRIGPGEGIVGLSWAILLAGSASTVVSQWQIDAESTSLLMVAFHRALRHPAPTAPSSAGAADALRTAALDVMRNGRYRHPFYWAGFRAVGATTAAR